MGKNPYLGSTLHFEVLGEQLTGKFSHTENKEFFKANFGVSPIVTSKIYKMIVPETTASFNPKTLLMALYFLKVYPNERVLSCNFEADRKSIMSKIWSVIVSIASLKKKVVSIFLFLYNK